jgi:hypothetical protein
LSFCETLSRTHWLQNTCWWCWAACSLVTFVNVTFTWQCFLCLRNCTVSLCKKENDVVPETQKEESREDEESLMNF